LKAFSAWSWRSPLRTWCWIKLRPRTIGAGFVAIYRDGSWQSVADHRDETVYSVTDGSATAIIAPGGYPAGTTTQAPATDYDKWTGKNG